MASDADLRKAGFTIEYAYDLQRCTVRVTHPAGLDATAQGSNRFAARSIALGKLRGQWQHRKVRRLLERHLAGQELRDWLEMCGLQAYDAMPRTDFISQPITTGYRRP